MSTRKLEINPHQWRALMLSPNARGVLSLLMSFACESEYYGIVQENGKNLTSDTLVENLPGNTEFIFTGLQELIEKNIVVYIETEPQMFVIPFMIKSFEIRKKRREAGLLGGNPKLIKKEIPVVSVQSVVSPETAISQEEIFYLTKKKRKLAGPQLQAFNVFWKIFNFPKGKAETADSWIDLKVNKSMFTKIIEGARKEAEARPALMDKGQTPKWGQGWLSAKRFEDEV